MTVKSDYHRNCREWITPSPRPNALLCPKCGCIELALVIDGYCQVFQFCPDCRWHNRPTVEEWFERLKAEFAAGKYDDDEQIKQYVAEMIYCMENDC
jgi:hypothetical protein